MRAREAARPRLPAYFVTEPAQRRLSNLRGAQQDHQDRVPLATGIDKGSYRRYRVQSRPRMTQAAFYFGSLSGYLWGRSRG